MNVDRITRKTNYVYLVIIEKLDIKVLRLQQAADNNNRDYIRRLSVYILRASSKAVSKKRRFCCQTDFFSKMFLHKHWILDVPSWDANWKK